MSLRGSIEPSKKNTTAYLLPKSPERRSIQHSNFMTAKSSFVKLKFDEVVISNPKDIDKVNGQICKAPTTTRTPSNANQAKLVLFSPSLKETVIKLNFARSGINTNCKPFVPVQGGIAASPVNCRTQ